VEHRAATPVKIGKIPNKPFRTVPELLINVFGR
jgi:hypothetical protein